jgi:hypothetical protein
MIPFVGGSYQLDFRKADVQRAVNLYPSIVESGTGKVPAVLNAVPGMTLFADLGAEIRGIHEAAGRLFVVAGAGLYELTSAGASTLLGTLSTSTGLVDMAAGLLQLVIVDGPNGYVLTLASNVFARIASSAFYGSARVGFLDGYFLFIRPDTQQFYWSAIDQAQTLDALDFASAESSPDELVSVLIDHRDLMLFGSKTVEGWRNTGSTSIFERNEGAIMEVGCVAAHSAQKLDSTFLWLGSDANGHGVVWMANGYRPQRVSNLAVEQLIQSSTDLTQASAYTYQQDGHSFYCLNAPGLETTLCFDVSTGQWHDRAELVDGEWEPIRGVCHAFCFNKHLIGAEDGKVYWLDKTKNTLDGDVLARERVSPHEPKRADEPREFPKFVLNCDVGNGKADGSAPAVQLRYSNDSGRTWSQWRTASLGAQGDYGRPVTFRRLGQVKKGGDRVWAVRCTDDTPFSIVGGEAE